MCFYAFMPLFVWHFIMAVKEFYQKIINNFVESFGLDINLWLIKYGLMNGQLQEHGTKIEITNYGMINQWICIVLCLFTAVKWSFFIFQSEDSQILDQLGEWSPFYGPKVLLDGMIIIASIHSLAYILLFNLGSRNIRMFDWLDSMEYHPQNGNFPKMNLNKSDSKNFVDRFTIMFRTAIGFNYSYVIMYGLFSCLSTYLHKYEYFFQYFISILLFDYQCTYMVNHVYGLIIISYQIFYYFQLKFHSLMVQAKLVLNQNPKRKSNRSNQVFKLIKHHNDICLMLDQFNRFWKYLLAIQMCFYVILTWLLVYVNFFVLNLDIFIKIILFLLPLFFIVFITGIVIVLITTSNKVIINHLIGLLIMI